MGRLLFALAFISFFIASQIFWIRQVGRLGAKFIRKRAYRLGIGSAGAAVYISLLAYNFLSAREVSATSLTLKIALLEAPLRWWVFSSLLGFAIVLPFLLGRYAMQAGRAIAERLKPQAEPDPPPVSLSRRNFLSNTAVAAGAVPFAACAYGFLFGRIEFEKSFVQMKLKRLPRGFDGFRIAQLSDIHIGPFMTSADVRHVVELTNALRADLVVLTGDYITWDPSTQKAAVESLSGLKSPFGIYGCLGNHEMWTHTEASITRLFAERNVKILRQERAPIQVGGENLNLIGVDFQSHRRMGRHNGVYSGPYLQGVRRLVQPGHVNILLSHNPNTFDRAAELGIDLSLAGHTHGGQISLEFISPDLSPARLLTPYVRGHFQKPGGQLYVNRGIGTIGVPIRFDAPPEITLFELVRA
ncbi:MAG: metallophosphoesterase [Acidobacteriota bacterium]